jgi:hypothetical protein
MKLASTADQDHDRSKNLGIPVDRERLGLLDVVRPAPPGTAS